MSQPMAPFPRSPLLLSMPDWLSSALIRSLRTFLQAFLVAYVGGLLDRAGIDGPEAFAAVVDALGDWSIFEQALGAGLVATLAFAQNLLEGLTPLAYHRG